MKKRSSLVAIFFFGICEIAQAQDKNVTELTNYKMYSNNEDSSSVHSTNNTQDLRNICTESYALLNKSKLMYIMTPVLAASRFKPPEESCVPGSEDVNKMCLTPLSCSRAGGYWQEFFNICSSVGYENPLHFLIGCWWDPGYEVNIYYDRTGIIVSVENDIFISYGKWAPISPSKALAKYDNFPQNKPLKIIKVDFESYHYEGLPAIYTRVPCGGSAPAIPTMP